MATVLRHISMTHGTLAPVSVLETFHAAGHLRKLRVLPGSGCPFAFWNSLCFPDGQLRQEAVKGVQLSPGAASPLSCPPSFAKANRAKMHKIQKEGVGA